MSIQEIREHLINYISEAEESKLQALHTLLDLDNETGYQLTEEQRQIVEERIVAYEKDPSRVISEDQFYELIKKKK